MCRKSLLEYTPKIFLTTSMESYTARRYFDTAEECLAICKKCAYNTFYGYFNCVNTEAWTIGRIITFVFYILIAAAVLVGLIFMCKRCATPDFDHRTEAVVVECEGNVTGVVSQPM